ncbi:MAG: SURF1 family protein [Caulobacteraceae bacterium]|nr:SURF1 family protein [Caulobacter sp.]
MTETTASRRGVGVRLVAVTLVSLAALAVLVALGAWQLQRKAWKEELLHRIAALQSAPPEPLAVVLNRAADPAAPGRSRGVRGLDFTRVQTLCDGLPGRGLHLYGLRADGPGWRQIAACTLPPGLPYRSLLVDLGFERLPPVSAPALQPVTLPARDASVVGVLRLPDPPAWTDRLVGVPAPADANGQWMRRNVPAMAAALHAPDPAPFMLELETPVAGPGLVPSPLPAGEALERIGEYAPTWFGLALALIGVYVAFVIRTLRPRRR